MKVAGVALVLLLSSCAVTAGFPPALKQAQDSYVVIKSADGSHACGATKVADRTVLTAEHCLDPGITIEGQVPVSVVLDGNDHALVVLASPIKGKAVKLSYRVLDYGEKLYLWGMPMGVGPLYREGIFAGTAVDPLERRWLVSSIMVIGGDSGSGVFDEKSRLVGTVSISVNGQPTPGIGWLGFRPYAFTAEQWKEAK